MIYYPFKKKLNEGSINLLTDTIKVALIKANYPLDLTNEFFNQVNSQEVIATGYTAGGQVLANKTNILSGNKSIFDADDLVWVANISARYAVMYKDTGNLATSPLIAIFDFGKTRVSYNQNFTIRWGEEGILQQL